MDVGHEGYAIDKFLYVKVKLDINVPLMREFTLDEEKDKGVEADVATENENEKKNNKFLRNVLSMSTCRTSVTHVALSVIGTKNVG